MYHFFLRAKASIVRRAGRYAPGGTCLCIACGQKLRFFLPFTGGVDPVPAVLKNLAVVGSDLARYACSNDRERHLLLYCQRTGIASHIAQSRVLHFAPERGIAAFIEALAPGRYVKADLYPRAADVQKVDMLHMDFADGTFDLVIANHVLEHVDDDARALSEIHRVLRSGGLAILQTPFSAMLTGTFEDPGIQSKDARTFAYGQDDHVRLYGQDIFQRFSAAGFVAKVASHEVALADISPDVYGVNPHEPFFLFERT
jgi:SAM-dependent methyltransferase